MGDNYKSLSEDSLEGSSLRIELSKRIAEGLSELPAKYQVSVSLGVAFRVLRILGFDKERVVKIVSEGWDAYEKDPRQCGDKKDGT